MNNGQMDRGNENPTQNLPWWLRKTTKKPRLGWSAPGFEPGTSRMRVSCVTTELPRSVRYICLALIQSLSQYRIIIQGVREISDIIVTDDYLCYKEPKSPYNFFLILIFNELLKFKTSDEWQHWKTGSPTLVVEVQLAKWIAGNCKQNETGRTP